ncbi:hypothetical protein AB0D38_33225 [Streptomyces sp. NPDC048279]|uniref:hypothetical protein n=1 Tax=Streptomyces sp. NPDC048279 TaxID=3154714 RepID=UPI00344A86E1
MLRVDCRQHGVSELRGGPSATRVGGCSIAARWVNAGTYQGVVMAETGTFRSGVFQGPRVPGRPGRAQALEPAAPPSAPRARDTITRPGPSSGAVVERAT